MLIFYFRKYYQFVIDFFIFLKSPSITIKSSANHNEKITESIILLILKFLFSILIATLIGAFYEPENLTDKSIAERFSPFLYLVIAGMLLPLFEETLFRLSIIFKPIYLSFSSACFGYYFSTKLIFNSRLSLVDETFYYRIGSGVLFGLIIFVILRNNRIKKQVQDIWIKKFRIIYYVSAIFFAWVHIFNFELNHINILLTPLLTLPQLFSGLIMGYLRVKFGFLYPLVFHILTNSILITLSILIE